MPPPKRGTRSKSTNTPYAELFPSVWARELQVNEKKETTSKTGNIKLALNDLSVFISSSL
jgi:hypothetical protein